MKSSILQELQHLANELDYSFFICDKSIASFIFTSTSFLRMMRISETEIKDDSRCWMTRIDKTEGEILDLLAASSTDEGEFQLELPFRLDHGDSINVQMRFSSIQKIDDQIYRFGSVIYPSINDLYKKEALQSRDHEIEISARIQKALLTGTISNTGNDLEIAADTLPSSKVDGDFYEFLWLAPRVADFIIGDVMGKGVPAALLGAGVKSCFFKALITHGGVTGSLPGIDVVLRFMDRALSRELIELEKFLTLYYCRLDMEKSLFQFVDAGHTSFIFHDASDNSCWSIKGANMPLGFATDQEYRKFLLPLDRDDLLFFYSDGISEVTNSEGELFGQERIMKLINAHHHLSPNELIRKVLNLTFFFAAHDFEDDVTAISIKIKTAREQPLKMKSLHFESTTNMDLSDIREAFSNDLLEIFGDTFGDHSARLLIALMEVLANCINYTESDLLVAWNLYAKQAEVSVSFTGREFDWFIKPSPDIESFQQRGFGSFLINEGTDSALLLHGRGERKRIILIREMV